MSYGIMSLDTENYVKARAAQEGIAWEKINVNPDWLPCDSCDNTVGQLEIGCENCEDGEIAPEFLRVISVIYGGALDEEFFIDDLYGVNVCDWLAEQCHEQAYENADDWEVNLSVYHPESSDVIYTRSSYETT